MRPRWRIPGVIMPALLVVAACGHGSANRSTHRADAPPRLVAAASAPGTVLSLYEGYDAVGVHEVHLDQGWRSSYVKLDEPADDLATLDGDRFAVGHGRSGRVVAIRPDGEPAVVVQLEPAPLRLASGDLDHDGSVDVVVLSDGTRPTLHVVRGHPEGFHPPTHVPLDPKGRRTPTLTLADLDREGSLDVITGLATGKHDAPIPDHLRVFRNTTHGQLVDESVIRVQAPEHVAAGDFDEDGLPDVLVTGSAGAWLLLSAGVGWLDAAEKISRGEFTAGGLVDLDRDGHLDIVLLRADRAKLEVRPGVGAGRAAPVQRYDVGEGPISMTVVDRDGDRVVVTANAQAKSFTSVRVVRRRPR